MATIAEITALRETLRMKRQEASASQGAMLGTLDTALEKINKALLEAAFKAGSVDDVLAAYVATRDEKEALIERQREEVAAYNERLRDIERWLMNHLMSVGAESIRAKTGTVFTKVVTSTKVDDRDAFFSWVLEHDAVDMLEARCSKTAVESFLESNGELPPGVSRRAEKVVAIHRPQAKH